MGLGSSLTNTPTTLRGLAMLALTGTCQVGALTSTDDSGGGASETWAYGANVPCRVDALTGGEAVVADRLSDRSTHLITLPAGTVITGASRLQTGGTTYEITAVRDHTGEHARLVEAVAI